jgi:fluoroquinolone transport system ATP-binding protein
MELLDRVGLRDAAKQKASAYSKGMRQRLTFVRALLNQPKYLFLDEPTSGLDPTAAANVRELIREQRQRGAAVFLTTHNMELADSLCDTVSFLNEGKIAAMDTPENLKRKFGKPVVELTYSNGDLEEKTSFFLEDKENLAQFIREHKMIKMHTQEATLEDIFLQVTGKELNG